MMGGIKLKDLTDFNCKFYCGNGKFEITTKEEENMEEKLNKYLEGNNILVDDNGDFEMYIVVDADDKDNEVGSIYHGKAVEAYKEDRAVVKIDSRDLITAFNLYPSPKIEIDKEISIKEDLLTIEDKMFKVLVNKENVVDVKNDTVYVNKYKIIEQIELNPVLKFKIKSINDKHTTIILYNSITQKSKTVELRHQAEVENLDDVKVLINKFLEEDERRVALINSTVDNGIDL